MELGEADFAGLAGQLRRRRPGRRQRARHGGQGDRDAVALLGRAVPEEFQPPRAAREGLQGLRRARRQRQRQRQQRNHPRDPQAARGEREAAWASPTFAAYRLEDSMAKTPEAVRGLLERVWKPARARALADRDELQALVAEEGGNFALAPWDWRYYAEKLRQRPGQFRRRRHQALSGARPHDRGRLRLRHPPVRRSPSPSARISRSGIPTCGSGRSRTAPAATRRCSMATTLPGPRSARAPG